MKTTETYIPAAWNTAAVAVFIAIVVLADGFIVALARGNELWLAVTVGAIAGLAVSIAWTTRLYVPATSALVVAIAIGMLALLGRTSWTVALWTAGVALAVWAVWFLVYDVWFTGRANAEFVSPVISIGRGGQAGRALIVHHRGRGPQQFQGRLQRAFADGLQATGWQVDLTTASHQTPTDLSRYDLLVLGAQSYNWCPARPIVHYLDRLGDLKGKPVVVVVSGGGMTERAMRVLQTRIVKAGGFIVDALEVWTSRSNEERHGLADPEAIMRMAGTRLTLAQRKAS